MMRTTIVAVLALAVSACGQQARELPAELGGRWQVQEIAGASLGPGVDAWLEIDPYTGAVHGYTGCNPFSATMTSFGQMIGVSAIDEDDAPCPSDAAVTDEARFLGVWGSVQRYILRGRSLQLLPAAQGSETLLTLRRSGPASEATSEQ